MVEAFDLLLRDLMETNTLFGGKIVVFSGDFRQTLPVILKCKVQVVDKSRPRDNKDKTTKYQVLILQDEEENQVQATIFSTDITYFEKEFAPFKTYLVSFAYVKVPPLGHENPLNIFIWTLDKNIIVEPIEEVKPPEDPLPPPTRLAIAKFDTFEYQPKEFEFDVLAIVINGSPSTKTTTGKRLQEFIVMDKLKKTTKLTLREDFIDHEGVKLFNQLHDYPIILARRIAKSSPGTSNRFIGLTSKFNTTIEINPSYPQAAELRT
ncbi:replication protein A 70 kDa DNA-binding subunit B-like [Solanum pennellii]|uniref:ATP-dependent DNA helicase n=1 Tax=Solanum pennellii TaxID=28526 RepID=A0ABM1VF07_SOLPN|nr:replication protein A 70 kDa DNA-binding subunit B-like [Solanum pennellii]